MFAAALVKDKQLKEEQLRRDQEAALAQNTTATHGVLSQTGSIGKVGLSDLFSSSPIPIIERTNPVNARQHALKPLPATSLNRATGNRAGLDIKRAMTAKTPAPRIGELQRQESINRMSQLHASVEFDENDFVDDADIDLDDDFLPPNPVAKPITYPKLPPLQTTPTYPSKDKSFTSAKSVINSSAPVAWSSSPLSHKLAHTETKPFKRPRLDASATPMSARNVLSGSQAAPVELESSDDDLVVVPASKRRMLPWQKPGAVTTTITPALSSHSETSFETAKTSRSPDLPVSATPAAKSTNPAYAWNTSVSAVKAQQKKLRTKTVQPKALPVAKDDTLDKTKTTPVINADNKVRRVFLSGEQRKVLDLIVDGKKSVFFTGSAGTGKSVLMREIIASLKAKYKHESDRVAVAASTGLAACNIGGVTLHSFAGIGLGKEPVEELVKKIKKNVKTKHRWLRTKILIIDEISMVDGATFDKLEQIARRIRNNAMTWGGIQLVVTGDFFQLPPVPDGHRVSKFAFEANTWQTAIDHTIGLTQVFRQKDPVFANMLNEMRLGKLTPESISTFKRLSRGLQEQDGITATELFPRREEVDKANRIRLAKLNGNDFEFTAIDSGRAEPANRERILAQCMAPQSLKLRKGAQVMLIKNIDETLVNGSIGKVVGFMDEMMFTRHDEQELDHEDPLADDETEDRPKLKPTLSGLSDKYAHGGTLPVWPLVRFQIPDGTTRDLLCHRESWKYELPNGEIQAERMQVPLIMAWALSIHKAQGQTLPRVIVDLSNIFEKGQAYVALSRATSQEGLQVLNFNPSKVQAHDKVKVFYDSLYAAGTIGKQATVAA